MTEEQVFGLKHYENVVEVAVRAPNRAFRATICGQPIWIQAYPFSLTVGPNRPVPNPVVANLRSVLPLSQWSNRTGLVRLLELYSRAREWLYVVCEYCPYGNLENLHLSEQSARRTFERILIGVDSLHGASIAHRSLSLGVILLDRDRLPVVSKLTTARVVAEPNKINATAHPLPLDLNYSPTELLYHSMHPDRTFQYEPFQVDIWHLGIMLYSATNRGYPFGGGDDDDGGGNSVRLIHARQLARDFRFIEDLSAPLKELISSMLAPAPEARPTVRQLMTHPWFRM